MDKITKIDLKKLIAENDIKQVIERLFTLFAAYIEKNGAAEITEFYDKLILLSGKLNGITQDVNLGIIDNSYASIEKSRINYSLLSLINEIPNKAFLPKKTTELHPEKSPDLRNRVVSELNQQEFEFDIFLSFSSKDKEAAKIIWEELRGYGLRVFLSNESLKVNVGQSFFEKIQHALVHSKHFVLLCTPDSMASEWVKTEYETFYNEFLIGKNSERKLVILKGQGFAMKLVPLLLRRLQFANDVKQIIESFLQLQKSEKPEKKTVEKEEDEWVDISKISEIKEVKKAASPPPVRKAVPKKKPATKPKKTTSKKAAPKKTVPKKNFEQSLTNVLSTYIHGEDYYLGANIPARKLKNARRKCSIPEGEKVLGLIDATVFGSAEECFVFTHKGIYYHNAWTAKKPGAKHVPYNDFKGRKFAPDGTYEVSLDKDDFFDASGTSFIKRDLVDLLNKIRSLL